MSARKPKTDLPELLREIAVLSRTDCRLAWIKAFRNDPPKYLSVSFMRRVLAQEIQCRKLGGHSAATKRMLKSALARRGGSVSSQTAIDGSTLVREWNGRIYRVDVSPEGYALDGKSYGSLSAVARHITGAHWSGSRFFGLSAKRSA